MFQVDINMCGDIHRYLPRTMSGTKQVAMCCNREHLVPTFSCVHFYAPLVQNIPPRTDILIISVFPGPQTLLACDRDLVGLFRGSQSWLL